MTTRRPIKAGNNSTPAKSRRVLPSREDGAPVKKAPTVQAAGSLLFRANDMAPCEWVPASQVVARELIRDGLKQAIAQLLEEGMAKKAKGKGGNGKKGC